MKKLALLLLIVSAASLTGYNVAHLKQQTPAQSVVTKSTITKKSVATFDKTQNSTSDPSSIWVVVNKQHALQPKSYVPSDLVVPNVPLRVPGNESMQLGQVSAVALEKMFADAKAQGLSLMLSSGYRSYSYQVSLYNSYVKSSGQIFADNISARPGFSEHQTGLAADIEPASQKCDVDKCFGDLPEGKWLAANAYKYGFIVRYTDGNQSITGYAPEPWHIRYVGVGLATELHNINVSTLEQFFGITGGASY